MVEAEVPVYVLQLYCWLFIEFMSLEIHVLEVWVDISARVAKVICS